MKNRLHSVGRFRLKPFTIFSLGFPVDGNNNYWGIRWKFRLNICNWIFFYGYRSDYCGPVKWFE